MRENFNFGFFGKEKEEHVKLMSYKALDWKGTIQFQQNKGFFFLQRIPRFFLVNSIKSKFSLFSLLLFRY